MGSGDMLNRMGGLEKREEKREERREKREERREIIKQAVWRGLRVDS